MQNLNEVIRAGSKQDIIERSAHLYRQLKALKSYIHMDADPRKVDKILNDIIHRARVTALELDEWFSLGALKNHEIEILQLHQDGYSVAEIRSSISDSISEYEIRKIIRHQIEPVNTDID